MLFVVVLQEVTKDVSGESLWELLYVDNLVIIAKSEEQIVWRFNVWKREFKTRGLMVNMDKTKMMVVGMEPTVRSQRGKYPYEVCGEGVRVNSVWCQGCSRWCHGRCSGLRNMNKAENNYRCAACVRGPVAMPREVAVKGGMLDVVENFSYLGDTMSCELSGQG